MEKQATYRQRTIAQTTHTRTTQKHEPLATYCWQCRLKTSKKQLSRFFLYSNIYSCFAGYCIEISAI